MEDTFDPAVERTRTALKLLDHAFHENTGDQEALAAIRAFRRITKGQLPSILFDDYYGEGGNIIREDEWHAIFSKQELEINALRNDVRRLTKNLAESKRRQRRGEGTETEPRPEKEDRPPPELTITDAEWEAISHLVPPRYRNDNGRARIAAMVVILRTGCGWRVLATPDKPDGWTTYYNQYNQKWRHEQWWTDVLDALKGFTCG